MMKGSRRAGGARGEVPAWARREDKCVTVGKVVAASAGFLAAMAVFEGLMWLLYAAKFIWKVI